MSAIIGVLNFTHGGDVSGGNSLMSYARVSYIIMARHFIFGCKRLGYPDKKG